MLGMWGMILGPAILFGFLALVPLLDRKTDDRPGRHGWLGVLALALGLVILGLWLYGLLGPQQQHLGM